MPLRVQRPGEKLDYGFDWDDGYLGEDEEISSSSWAVEPDGPTLEDGNIFGKVAVIWVTAGVPGHWVLTNSIVTSEAREAKRSLTIAVVPQA